MAIYQGNVGEAPNTVWPPQSGNGDWGDDTNYPINTHGVSTASPLGDPDSSNPPGGPGCGYSNPDTQMTHGGSGESLGRTSAMTGSYTRQDGTEVDVPPPTTLGANVNTSPTNPRGGGTLGAPSQKYSGQNAPGFWETFWDWTSSTTIFEKLNPNAPTPVDATFGVSATGAPLDSSGKPRPAANYQAPDSGKMPAWEKGLIAAGLIAAGAVVVFGLRETKGLVAAVKA